MSFVKGVPPQGIKATNLQKNNSRALGGVYIRDFLHNQRGSRGLSPAVPYLKIIKGWLCGMFPCLQISKVLQLHIGFSGACLFPPIGLTM